MERKIIKTKNAPSAIGPYEQANIYGNLIFSSGQIAINPETNEFINGGIKEQTVRVFENLSAILKEAGSSFAKVLKTTVFLKDMNDFTEVNKIYASYFEGGSLPSRSCVEVATLPKGALIEIEVIAYI